MPRPIVSLYASEKSTDRPDLLRHLLGLSSAERGKVRRCREPTLSQIPAGESGRGREHDHQQEGQPAPATLSSPAFALRSQPLGRQFVQWPGDCRRRRVDHRAGPCRRWRRHPAVRPSVPVRAASPHSRRARAALADRLQAAVGWCAARASVRDRRKDLAPVPGERAVPGTTGLVHRVGADSHHERWRE